MALSDVEISRITGIPCITLARWKKKDDYRKDLYDLLKRSDESFLVKNFSNRKNKENVVNAVSEK